MKNAILGALLLITCGAIGLVVFGSNPQQDQYDAFERVEADHGDTEDGYVVESEAQSADECASMESYDEERGVCYFECDDDAQCDALQQEVDAELEGLGNDYVASGETFHEPEAGDAPDVIASYDVSAGEHITLASGEATARHQEVWKLFSRISPDAFTDAYVRTFELSDNPSDDTLAYVHDEDGDGYWAVGVNLGTFGSDGKREDILTLVHEFTHIVTLNQTQVVHGATCITYDTGDGCATAQSYLYTFVKKFWPESDRTVALSDTNNLYERAPEKYPTEYAATSPVEDIAESFALFVLDGGKDNAGTIAGEKIAFFESYPELVALKQSIRKGLGTILLERKRATQGE